MIRASSSPSTGSVATTTLDENPALGPQGLYYYYLTFAKALTAYGDDKFTDVTGKTHDWRYEMMN